MKSRLQKLEQARHTIFNKLICSIPQNKNEVTKTKIIEIFIMLKNSNLLFIGKEKRFKVSNLNNQKIEDALNILQQFSFISNYDRICGDVFRVKLFLKPKSDSMIVLLKIQKSKAA